MFKKSTFFLITASILHFTMCILAGSLNWYNQLMIVPIVSILIIVILIDKIVVNKYLVTLVLVPFFGLYSIFSLYNQLYPTYPIWILGILISLITIVFYKRNRNHKLLFTIISCLIIGCRFLIMPSYSAYLMMDKNVKKYTLTNITLKDENGQPFDNRKFQGKTVVIDIWTTSCSQCIKKFPKLESINEKYKSDSSILIISLNLPIDREDDYKLAIEYSSPFKFKKLFYNGLDGFEKLKIKSVPTLLIFNNKQQCIYAGDFNIEWNVFIGNTYNLLKSITTEK